MERKPPPARRRARPRLIGLSTALGALALAAMIAVPGRAQEAPSGRSQAAAPESDGPVLRVGLFEGGQATVERDYAADPAVFSAGRLWRCCLARTLMAYPGLPLLEGGTVLHPDLAADHPKVSADGLLWSFTIRPGVRYQPPFDDRTVVAADIIRAIERNARVAPELADTGGRSSTSRAPWSTRGARHRSSAACSPPTRARSPSGSQARTARSVTT